MEVVKLIIAGKGHGRRETNILKRKIMNNENKKLNGFEQCKTLKEGWYVKIHKKNNYPLEGVITYYDYGDKQLAINNVVVNFEEVLNVEILKT